MSKRSVAEILGEVPRVPRVVYLARAQLLAFVAAALSFALLVLAGMALSQAGIGLAAVRRGCEGEFLLGLVLLVFAGVALAAARLLADLATPQVVELDPVRTAVVLPVPAVALALTAPGFLGCTWAGTLDAWGAVGRGLLGTPGIAVAAAAAFGLGLGAATLVRLRDAPSGM